MIRRRVFVSGRVQGVFFRDSLARLARDAGVSGWARNTYDGRVEVVLEGDELGVERVLAFCREGPPRAVVTGVEVQPEDPTDERGFHVR